jgi:transcriptional regulator with XRE-family HTH domain
MMNKSTKTVDFLTKIDNLLEAVMLTEFGQYLRKLRIDCDELLKDMSDKLGVTSSYLSAVETGKRNIPDDWVEKISKYYSLHMFDKEALQIAAANSALTVTMDLSKMVPKRKETALLFARKFDSVDDSTIETIRKLLNG